jgi:drug/metabolite transporter (DMT)-like permease
VASPGIILALAAAVTYNLGFVLEKRALGHLPAISARHAWRLVRTLFTAPGWLGGFALICAGLVMQVLVLSLEPLTIAQPLQASGVVLTLVFSRLILRERLTRAETACAGIMAAAVVLLGLSSGHGPAAGSRASGAAVAVAVAAAFLAGLAGYGWARRARRRRRPAAGLSDGLCAGLIYGAAGLALKALSAVVFGTRVPAPARAAAGGWTAVPHPAVGAILAAVRSPYLYVMLGCVVAGLCMFQAALQRSPASIVIPVCALASSGYLVLAGSWLFHERLPPGPVPLAMRVAGGAATVVVPVILATARGHRAGRHRRTATSRRALARGPLRAPGPLYRAPDLPRSGSGPPAHPVAPAARSAVPPPRPVVPAARSAVPLPRPVVPAARSAVPRARPVP